jgi:hypothetical protein
VFWIYSATSAGNWPSWQTQIIGTRNPRWADSGKNRLGAYFLVLRLLTATPRQMALVRCRGFKLQQFRPSRCAGLVPGRAHRPLDGFPIPPSGLAAFAADGTQHLLYLACDFLLDRLCRFFCGVKVSSTGRSLQICS